MIELLTLSGASLEIEDEDGDTPFHSASSLAVMDHLAEGQYHLITSHSTVVVGITLQYGRSRHHPWSWPRSWPVRADTPSQGRRYTYYDSYKGPCDCALTLRSLH